MLDISALWLLPGREHPVFRRYGDFFARLFRHFVILDYRERYLDVGPEGLEGAIFSAVKTTSPQLLLYSQFAGSYAYLSPAYLAGLRSRCPVVGLGFDDEIYFEQAKFFYQACSAVITTDIEGAARLGRSGIPAYLAQLQQPHVARGAADAREDIPISFVGNVTKPGRREFILHLEAARLPVADYGAGSRKGRITDAEVIDVFCRSKINLNFTGTNPPRWILRHDPLRAEVRQIKGRPFELAALGKFCLCEWAPCVEHWFRPGVEIGVFHDPDDLVIQAQRYLQDDALRRSISVSARDRYRTEHAPDVQFTRIFTRILSEPRRTDAPAPLPAPDEPIFFESMGRSRGVAFLHALHRGSPSRALREIFMKWSGHLEYWRGFAEAIMDTIASRWRV